MEMMTVSEVSKKFDISTRMLRYYEKIGIIKSFKKEDYAYRIYDEEAVRRLQLVIVMRKLRVPLKQIAVMLDSNDCREMLEILLQNISELGDEIKALETIRGILQSFAQKLDNRSRLNSSCSLIDDNELVQLSNALRLSKHKLKEEHHMNDLNAVNDTLGRNINVRIVLLPPYTVASCHYIGENPEEAVHKMMDEFIRESRLYEIKPDSRMFGFNHPSPSEQREHYGYEVWVTIPNDMEVPNPLTKKEFKGGLYAAHTIDFPNFNEWGLLNNWVNTSEIYRDNLSELGDEIMMGALEEHLNKIYESHRGNCEDNRIDGKIDLLLPIKFK